MKTEEKIEIKNNEFLRQFEARIGDELVKLEYSEQPRKIFLTKFVVGEKLKKQGLDQLFLTAIFDKFAEEGTRIVPTCQSVTKFYKSHRSQYKKLLPTGINL